MSLSAARAPAPRHCVRDERSGSIKRRREKRQGPSICEPISTTVAAAATRSVARSTRTCVRVCVSMQSILACHHVSGIAINNGSSERCQSQRRAVRKWSLPLPLSPTAVCVAHLVVDGERMTGRVVAMLFFLRTRDEGTDWPSRLTTGVFRQ